MSPQDHCALCGNSAALQKSHILPSFVFRWKKDTSITGYLRFGEAPRRRVQDGLKIHLLCSRCEGLLNDWETKFATVVFHPYNADDGLVVAYGDWMLKFCVSVSWRVLTYVMRETDLRGWTVAQRAAAVVALERWRSFMLGETANPGQYEQHLLPLPVVWSTNTTGMPTNMNRYLARHVEIDAAAGESTAFVYSKMGRFALFGLVVPTRNRWKGTRIPVKGGVLKPGERVLPIELLEYLQGRAEKLARFEIPDHQADKIEADLMRDPTRTTRSDQFAAMMRDAQMFGVDAIVRKRSKPKDS